MKYYSAYVQLLVLKVLIFSITTCTYIHYLSHLPNIHIRYSYIMASGVYL